MAQSGVQPASLRLSPRERRRLLAALAISLVVHLLGWGGYLAEKKFGWWSKLTKPLHRFVRVLPKQPVVEKKVEPVIFLDVADPSTEPPKQARYYSANNSRAANPDANVDSNQPKINGKQTVVTRLEDVPKPVKAKPVEPVTPQKPVEAKPPQPNPANTLMPGELEKGKPEEAAKTDPQQPAKPERPRTLREAQAQRSNQLPGLAMQQDGGVKHRAIRSSLDAMATPFGAYDRAIIEAVSQRWYDLLDSQQFASDRTGKVTVTFHLNPDGSVTEARVASNTVGDLLGYVCQAAIEQAAPFGKWPPDMRRMVGANFREITFTFYYY